MRCAAGVVWCVCGGEGAEERADTRAGGQAHLQFPLVSLPQRCPRTAATHGGRSRNGRADGPVRGSSRWSPAFDEDTLLQYYKQFHAVTKYVNTVICNNIATEPLSSLVFLSDCMIHFIS